MSQISSRPSLPPSEDGDLLDYAAIRDWIGFVLRSPRRHKAIAALTFLSVVALSILALKTMPYRYQVQASLLAQRSPLMGTLVNPGMNRDWDLPTRAAREVVLRRDNLISLAKETNFVDRYLASRSPAVRWYQGFLALIRGHEPSREEVLDGIVDALAQRLWVVVNGNEGTVTITFQWSDPELAYDVVSAAVQGFMEARHASEISAMGETIAILQAHDARVQVEIAEVSKALDEKGRALRGRSLPGRAPSTGSGFSRDEELVRLQAQLAARRRALADLEEFRQRRLAELQSQLAQQVTVYAPQHPSVVSTRQSIETLASASPQMAALRAEVADLEQQIERRGARPGREAASATVQLQAELAEARLRLADEDPRLEYERAQLRLLLRQHSNLLDRIDAARVEMDTAQAAFKYRYVVTSPPQMPRGPLKPTPWMVLMGGILGGIGFAFFACTVLDLSRGQVVEAWQVERQLKLPVLAEFNE